MDLLHGVSEILALFLFIQSTTPDGSTLSPVATCKKTESPVSSSWLKHHNSNPSPIRELTAKLSESQTSVIIQWSINIDSSIGNLTGTRIELDRSYYECEYEPPFSSQRTNLTGLQQLWFNFTVPNVCPSEFPYHITAYNLPEPPVGTGDKYIKTAETDAFEWKTISLDYAVYDGEKVMVIFTTNPVAERLNITLKNSQDALITIKEKRGCTLEPCKVELDYKGLRRSCEDLTIRITAHFENCQDDWAEHKVDCVISEGSVLAVTVGGVLVLLSVLLCCCITCLLLRQARVSRSVRVLLVYPAVDSVFQRSVVRLAEFLQTRGSVSVVLDLWERAGLAEQGPLRWINTQTELADKVLIFSPPQHTHNDDHKTDLVPGVADHSVPASAGHLFALTLNLVSSAAPDPHGWDKFWVINLEQQEKSVQTELRGFRTFVLPRDQEKLYRKLTAGGQRISALSRCFKNAPSASFQTMA